MVCLFAACEEQTSTHEPLPGAATAVGQAVQAASLSARCAACHPKEYEQWQNSDHALALRRIDVSVDSEPFHGQRLAAHGSELTFSTDKTGTFHLQDAQTGRKFEVAYVLGRRPLVQYLVKAQDGGWHTPSAAWDVERHEWFDMFEADARLSQEGLAARAPGDWGHWLGRGMNWNSQCAWCHTSHFRKNYDMATNTFSSVWKEDGVSCIQCHKPANNAAEDGCLVAPQDRKLTAEQMHDNCATCHARREELDEAFVVGKRFEDHFRLELPIMRGIFWPNGMQRDEVYCETGLRLSRMGAAGVTCLDCHDPHTAELKLPQEDNTLCMRCHAAGTPVNGTPTPVVNMATHTPCPPNSKGARCVECHMPESPYMARDPRRDHSFNSPDPQLSQELGIPNACTMCHAGMSNEHAARVVAQTYPAQKMATVRERTRAVHAAQEGCGNPQSLLKVLAAETVPAWRATLLELLAQHAPTVQAKRVAAADAAHPDPLVRAAVARVLGRDAGSLLRDPVKLVRREAAWPLLDVLAKNASYADLLEEQRLIALQRAEQPNGAMQLAEIATVQQHWQEAEKQYRRALTLDPASPVVYMDYAVFLAGRNRLPDALTLLQQAVVKLPDNADVHYYLGRVLYDMGRYADALPAFEKTVELSPNYADAPAILKALQDYLSTKNNSAQ